MQQDQSPGKSSSIAPSGNASNPSPEQDKFTPSESQLIDERGEKYLHEVASIEDYPDAEDQQNMDERLEDTK